MFVIVPRWPRNAPTRAMPRATKSRIRRRHEARPPDHARPLARGNRRIGRVTARMRSARCVQGGKASDEALEARLTRLRWRHPRCAKSRTRTRLSSARIQCSASGRRQARRRSGCARLRARPCARDPGSCTSRSVNCRKRCLVSASSGTSSPSKSAASIDGDRRVSCVVAEREQCVAGFDRTPAPPAPGRCGTPARRCDRSGRRRRSMHSRRQERKGRRKRAADSGHCGQSSKKPTKARARPYHASVRPSCRS